MIQLRDYQSRIVDETRSVMRAGCRRVLITAPTGSGKTALAAHVLASAAAKGRRSWFVCHRRELLDQSVAAFIESADIHTGIIASGYPSSPSAPVQVCSVQTLGRRLAQLQLPDLIVFDESHHVASRTWSEIAAAAPNATHIGLTASPIRLDGRGLGAYFDTLIQGPTVAELTAQGWLSPYRYYAPTQTDLSGVHRVAGDFNKREAADVMEHSTVIGDAVSHYLHHGDGGRALVFAWSIEASQGIAASFRAEGIEAEHVDGETHRGMRTAAMRRFRDGTLRVLCNVDLFGEGLDVPAVDCVFLLRPTQSLGLYLQQVGRGLRPAPTKSVVRIFDHVNNWQRHGLPDDDRTWTLTGDTTRTTRSEPMGKRCGVCFGISRLGAVRCALCGAVLPVKPRTVTQVKGELHAVDVDVLRALGMADEAIAPVHACQRCGKPCANRFCGSACFLAARRQWRRTA